MSHQISETLKVRGSRIALVKEDLAYKQLRPINDYGVGGGA